METSPSCYFLVGKFTYFLRISVETSHACFHEKRHALVVHTTMSKTFDSQTFVFCLCVQMHLEPIELAIWTLFWVLCYLLVPSLTSDACRNRSKKRKKKRKKHKTRSKNEPTGHSTRVEWFAMSSASLRLQSGTPI